MKLSIKGSRLTVRFVEDDDSMENWNELPSWKEATAIWQEKDRCKDTQIEKAYVQLHIKMQRMANGARLRNPDHFNTEADLPDKKKFYAIKQGKMRAYGWFSNAEKGVFIISHFACKKGRKLAPADTRRVVDNWEAIERGGL